MSLQIVVGQPVWNKIEICVDVQQIEFEIPPRARGQRAYSSGFSAPLPSKFMAKIPYELCGHKNKVIICPNHEWYCPDCGFGIGQIPYCKCEKVKEFKDQPDGFYE